ncbi:helix-turn-helix transcriptional regulator [Nocardia beijingensis]|uniref:helix-turn-helix domain-containing protein n=1 Tax=Nocardia beijingensis TaxID=95162 RepID=UPI00344D78D8
MIAKLRRSGTPACVVRAGEALRSELALYLIRDIILDMSEEVAQLPDEESLPVLPGFREMALRRITQDRAQLIAELTQRRRAAGLSQTEVAARMGTSQSAVARLEAENVDVRTSTLQRYAAAVGSRLTLQVTNTTAETNRIGEQP